MPFSEREIFETIRMVEMEHFDIRTVTLGVNCRDCARTSMRDTASAVRDKLLRSGERLVSVVDEVQAQFGIPVVNRRLAVTPMSHVGEATGASDYTPLALALEAGAVGVGADFIGGFSALVQKGATPADLALIRSIPEAMAATTRVCSSVNVATSRVGINMEAVRLMGEIVKATAQATADRGGFGAARLVVFANVPDDNPFMAGAFMGAGEPDQVVNVGVSGPGVVRHALEALGPKADLGAVAEVIKRTSFKITRAGELIGREVARRLGVEFGVLDLSLAPTPAPGDSIADILELMGLESTGCAGTTAALALLTDAVKKGGAMASSHVGGLSGAFIPVSEDMGMVRAVQRGSLTLEKLEAMSSVCSVGLDMVAVPGDTPVAVLAALIADEMAIGVINHKTTAVRIIPVPGGKVGEVVDYGGLWGTAPIMAVNPYDPSVFVARGGRIPAPIHSLRN